MIDLVRQLSCRKHRKQGVENDRLEVGPEPLDVAPRPTRPQDILRRDLPLLAVVIAQLNGVGAVLIDDDDDVQTAATRPEPGAESAQHNEPGQPAAIGAHRCTVAQEGQSVNSKLPRPRTPTPCSRTNRHPLHLQLCRAGGPPAPYGCSSGW